MKTVQLCVVNVTIVEDYIVHRLDVDVRIKVIFFFTNSPLISHLGEVTNSVYNGSYCVCINSTRYANQACGAHSKNDFPIEMTNFSISQWVLLVMVKHVIHLPSLVLLISFAIHRANVYVIRPHNITMVLIV